MKRRTYLLLLLLLVALVPVAQAQESTFGLSQQDFALFNTANAASATLSAVQFDFSFSFSVGGLPDVNVSADLTGSGALDTLSSAGALQLVLNGSVNAPQPTPIEGELRLIDNLLYISGFSALGNTSGGWQATDAAELLGGTQSAFMGGFNETSNLPVEADELTSQMMAALATLDPSEFITISRLADEAVNGVNTAHFSANVSLSDLASSSAFSDLLRVLANTQTETGVSEAQIQSGVAMVQMMLTNSTISYDSYFGADDNLLRRAALNADLTLDGAMLGGAGNVTLSLHFDVTLSEHNQPQQITAPEGAQVISSLAAQETSLIPTTLPTNTPASVTTTSKDSLSANVPTVVAFSGSPVDLRYSGSTGEVISVTARSLAGDSLDVTVEVLDASGTRLAYNDDHGSARTDLTPRDALIRDLNLFSAGDVTIRVSTFVGSGAGDIEVLVESGSAAAPTPEPGGTASTTGGSETIDGVVVDGSSFTHQMIVQAGETLTITVAATDNALDPRVALISPSGAPVAQNDDHGTDNSSLDRFDSRISDQVVTEAGTYTIEITGFGGVGGSFVLTIERAGGGSVAATPVPVPTQTGSDQAAVETIVNSISPNGSYVHEFTAQAGDMYVITASAGDADFDPRVAVYFSAGNLLFANDDHGTSDRVIQPLDARITNLIIPQTGSYEIEVTGYSDSAGEFELTLERVATGAPLGAGEDEIFTGSVGANGTYTQTFEAQAGTYLTITARSLGGDFDPQLVLLSPNGVLVADNDDHGSAASDLSFLDSRIFNYPVTQAGTYTIEVRGYRGGAGSFAVTVTTLR